MNENEIKKEIIELRKNIHQWNDEYFNNDNPSVSDAQYDAALIKLKKLESKYFHLFTLEENNNSPTKIVGGKVDDLRFRKIKHKSPMLSLNKAYSLSELKKFAENVEKLSEKNSYYVEPKIDGISISLHYKNGNLDYALTRGDGLEGEDVTHNILVIDDKIIPKKLSKAIDIEVRGEIYLDKTTFDKLNIELQTNGKTLLANPRNAAAGTLRQLDSSIAKERNLKAFLYQIVNVDELAIDTVDLAINELKNLGFQVNLSGKLVHSIEEAYEVTRSLEKNNFDYEIDGVVIKVNDFSLYSSLGKTSKFPHSAIAFKFDDEIVETKLKDIFPTVGRTGIITYNAVLEPVRLNGSLVSAATLHNYTYIRDLAICIGDKVYVKKAGEIIPKVLGSVEKHESTNYQRVEFCPSCHSPLFLSETEIDQFCLNEECSEIKIKKIIHFASKGAMNIEGLGEKIIRLFFNKKLIENIWDIYYLKDKTSKLFELEGFQEKSIMNLINAIERTKNIDLYRLIFSLGIKHIGEKNAKFLAKEIGTIENFLHFNFDTLIDSKDIGEKTIESLKEYFSNEKNLLLISELSKIKFIFTKEETYENIFDNISFVITGTLSRPRKEIQNILEKYGAKINSSISSQTNYLIVGENAGSKEKKAKELNVKIIQERELQDLIEKMLKEKENKNV